MTLFMIAFAIGNQTSAQTKDSGTYTVYVGDLVLAEEIYVRETVAGGVVKTVSKVAAATYITTVKDDKPLEFTIETNGKQVLKTVFGVGEAKTLIAGQPEKTIKTGTSIILENSVWSQYANLLAQYDRKKNGAQNFVGFLPGQSYEFSLTLEKTATKDFKLNGQTISLDKYKLVNTKSDLIIEIWADKTNVPFLIEIPAQLVQVVKKGFEELRVMTAPPKTPMMNFTGEFTSEEVSFPNAENTLAGTLTLPKNNRHLS
jgi:hypothetical protein